MRTMNRGLDGGLALRTTHAADPREPIPHRPIELIGAQIGAGARDPGCRAGAPVLAACDLAGRLEAASGRPVAWGAMVEARDAPGEQRLPDAMDAVAEFSPRLAQAVSAALARARLPLVVGGDHSCAVGTWSAIAAATRPAGRLGLVWIDAHLDSHTPRTSPTQAPHGMPLAALLGHGPAALTEVCGAWAKLDPRDLAIVGARSGEAGEARLLRRLGVRVIGMPEVRARSFGACLREAARIATARTARFGVSFDLDALDPRDAPGTGTPVAGGIRAADAIEALADLGRDARLAGVELVEYNPQRDAGGRTAQVAIAVGAALAGAAAP